MIFHFFTEKPSWSDYEHVIGSSSDDFYFDYDWGFFSTILACYNNHWVLRTSPDDWWYVIVRNETKQVNLYCPPGWERGKEMVKELQENLSEREKECEFRGGECVLVCK